MIPETRYAKTVDGVHIAYQALGEGPMDLAFIPGFIGNIELLWEQPIVASFLRKLASFSHLVLHDRRGTGMSDRVARLPDLETRMDDLRTVLDTVGIERTVPLGGAEGGALAALFASTYPDRVAAVIWYAATARTAWAPDYPWGTTEGTLEEWVREAEEGWGTEAFANTFLQDDSPTLGENAEFVRWLARMHRHWVTPGGAATLFRNWYETDVRHVLPAIRAPVLILSKDGCQPLEEDAYIVGSIPGAEQVTLHGVDAMPFAGDQDKFAAAIRSFLGSVRAEEAEFERVLATVLFTDIVGSTEKAAQLGDRAWRELVERHHAGVRALLERYRGVEVDTAGDGFFATFDGPARAIRCARAIVEEVRPLGIEVRAGLHTGECETIDGKVGGIAVNIGARVGAAAAPSEVLVSQTVKDLVAGSGLVFEDRGEHELNGVPDRWRLYRVASEPT